MTIRTRQREMKSRRSGLEFPAIGALALALALAACAPADTGGNAASEATEAEAVEAIATEAAQTTAPPVQSEWLADLGQLRDKYVALAEAVPEESYGWRPADGVRSVSEVYMHIVAANFGIVASVLGESPPEGTDPAWMGQDAESVTDKATIVAALGASFDFVARVIEGTSDERLLEEVGLFGNPATARAALTLVITHCHEHLGQSIAYARTNGVVPPWSM